MRVTALSTWSWLDHPVSGLPHATERPVQTRFRFGSECTILNLATYEQLAGSLCKRHAVTPYKMELRPLVGIRFQVLFHSPLGVLFTFPSRY